MIKLLPLLTLLCLPLSAPAQVIISELMANNTRTLADEDGEFEDWIELHNETAAAVDLEGWSLTDNALNRTKWTFPAVSIPAKGYLIVWTSNKNRRTPGTPLHTNFKLDGDGEYLALLKPDLTAATEFAPAFLPQMPDLSYGPAAQTSVTTAIQQGSSGAVHVPADGSLGLTWTGRGFVDSTWTPATNGIGFETGANEFGAGWTGEIMADAPAGYYRMEETSGTTALNQGSAGAAANGIYTGAVTLGQSGPLPPAEAGMPTDNKTLRVAGAGYVQTAYSAALNPTFFSVECWARATGGTGAYRAAVSGRNDTGSQTQGYIIYAASTNTWQFWTGSGGSGVWAPITGPAVTLNAWVHLVGTFDGTTKRFYVNGTQAGSITSSAFNPNVARGLRIGAGQNEGAANFLFQGDVDEVAIYPRALSAAEISARYALGKNNTAAPPVNDFAGLISTGLQTQMSGVNASAYFRLPFTVADAAAIDGLILKMKYDDGFQAYLNGVPVAGGNVPPVLTWNSGASERSSNSDAVQFESFSLNSALSSLQNGPNVLAIHGLNLDAANPDYLQLAQLELTDVGTYSTTPVYLTTASPGSVNSNGSATPGPVIHSQAQTPAVPTTADDLTITCRALPVFAPISSITLNWRTAYNALQQTAMTDNGTAGDVTAGDGIYTAVIAKTNYAQGQMVRWYFTGTDTSSNASRWPVFTAGAAAPEYFGTMIAATGFTTTLPVWYWFAQNTGAAATRSGTRGSVFYNGALYDNVFIRLRGGATSSGSKKFDFNTGAHCLIDAEVGRIEEANLNGSGLGGADTIIRPPVAFALMRRSGHPACASFPVMMRVNGALDTASGRGGVAYFVEQVDERFLRRHGFDDDGALYKMDQRGNLEPVFTDTTDGVQKRTRLTENNGDLQALVNAIHSSAPDDWARANPNVPPAFPAGFTATRTTKLFDMLNMANIVNYLAARVIIGDVDDTRKNFYLYRDSDGDLEWRIFPWDKDGTLGLTLDAAPWVGHPFQADWAHRKSNNEHQWNYLYEACFNEPKIRAMVLRRLRTLMDTILGATAGGPEALVDSIWAPIPATTPVIGTFSGVTPNSLKSFFNIRRIGALSTSTSSGLFTVYSAANGLGTGIQIPPAQLTTAEVYIGTIEFLPATGNQLEEFVEIVNPNNYDIDISGWYVNGGISHTFEPGTVIRDHDVMYLVNNKNAFRARTASPHGGQDLFIQGGYNGSLSARGEVIQIWDPMAAGDPGDDRNIATGGYMPAPSPAQLSLRITEIMYDPPSGGSFPPGEYEFIELMNISAVLLNLNGVTFTDGITFTFGATTMNPGARIVLVKNPAAFTERYGNGPTIAGTYTGALDNSGERIRIVDAMGEEVLDFRYEGTWYPSTHGNAVAGGGSSLVIEDESAAWDTWGQQYSWRASSSATGSPGAADSPPVAPVITRVITGTIHLSGNPGRSYLLQRSIALGTWSDLALTTAGASGIFEMSDPAGPSRAFYRVRAK